MDFVANNYRARRLGNKFFVTTDSGSWVALSEAEFRKLKNGDIIGSLYEKLREREIILDKNNADEFARDLRKRSASIFFGTSLHIIVVTLRCNMKCVYCHASSVGEGKGGFDMDEETARKTVDFIFQSPSQNITIEFQGGEPLLNWGTVKFIVDYAKEKNKQHGKSLKFALVTNLSLMDEEKMEYLLREEVPICTSLDGPKELHDSNRVFSRSSNYEQVVGWVKRFKEEYLKRGAKGIDINALTTLTRKSLAYPEQIVDEYVHLGLKEIHLRFLNNLGVAQKAWHSINYSAEEYLLFWDKAMARIRHHQSQGVEIRERMEEIMNQKIRTKFDPGYLDLRSPCGAAIGQLVYNYDGSIYTCDEGRMLGDETFLLGNVREDTYNNVVTCGKACAVLNASLNEQFVCDACAYKPYCGLCPVCSFAERGSIISNVAQSDRCKIFKHQFDRVVTENFIN